VAVIVRRSIAGSGDFALCATASAAPLRLSVKIENLAPTDSVSFAPLPLRSHSGVFDAFDSGSPATAPIISVAEGGSGSDWQPAFAAADPAAIRGTIGGLLQPGEARSGVFVVDTMLNPFFTFASMVVPSNDFFIGNDSPTSHRLFDASGRLVLASILQTASDIWDAGSESFDPAAAAFVGTNALRTARNGVVRFNFAELAGFNGLPTGAGYVFTSGLAAATEVYRISFAEVPEPGTWPLLAGGLFGAAWIARRRPGRTLASGIVPA